MQFAKDLNREDFRNFGPDEHETWRKLFGSLADNRRNLAHPLFEQGVRALGLSENHFPDIDDVNRKLKSATGWKAVPVTGLEESTSFYPALMRKEFPVGNFIRSSQDLGYTPAPDIFHDLYGHIPFLMDQEYANFCYEFGRLVTPYIHDARILPRIERFFWFAGEFPLVETKAGRRIFGGGLLSSKAESEYSLSSKPTVIPFNVKTIIERPYRIDVFQDTLFLLKSPEELYNSLGEFKNYLRN